MTIGYAVSVALPALCTLLALSPLRSPRTLALLSWRCSFVIDELPFLAFYWLLLASVRFEAVVDAIEGFTAWVRSTS